LKSSLLQYLACPRCGERFEADVRERDREIKSGTLRCVRCKSEYPILGYIPRFVEYDHYAGNFSLEWNAHRLSLLDSFTGEEASKNSLLRLLMLSPPDFSGRLFLDAGCGAGRFSQVVANYGGEIVCIDLSYAVEACYENLGAMPNVHVIQGNLLAPPLRRGLFDHVFSIGVLQHVPLPAAAFAQIAPLLKRGWNSSISVAVYSDEGSSGFASDAYVKARNRMSSVYRSVTKRLPIATTYKIAKAVASPLYHAKAGKGRLHYLLDLVFPSSMHPREDARVLDTFDWYSPKYQFYFSRREVQRWYLDAHLTMFRLQATNNGIWASGGFLTTT
jgi:SAM-dependent methyltransferase